MKILASIFNWLEITGLAIWIGGMLTLGALVAPTVFNTVEPFEAAGEVMTLIFRKFNGGLVYVCIFLAGIGYVGKCFLTPKTGRPRWIEGCFLAVMMVSAIYIGAILGPRIQELREIKNADASNSLAQTAFDRGHRLSERLFSLNLLLGLGVLFVNARESLILRKEPNGRDRPSA